MKVFKCAPDKGTVLMTTFASVVIILIFAKFWARVAEGSYKR